MNSLKTEIEQSSIAGRKSRNDDSYGIVVPEAPVLEAKGIAIAIADGMSSSEAAKEASECCVRSFLEDCYATHESWTIKRSVVPVLQADNAWLYTQGLAQECSERGMEHLSRAFGINQNLEIDYRQEILETGDVYVLTTDGVHLATPWMVLELRGLFTRAVAAKFILRLRNYLAKPWPSKRHRLTSRMMSLI